MKRLVIARPARQELREAAYYYLERSTHLRRQFLDDLEKALRLIQAFPAGWQVVQRDARRHLLSRFPYALVYRDRPREIRIIAVAHLSRRPYYWRRRH